MTDEVKKWLYIAVGVLVVAVASFMLGGYLHTDRAGDATVKANYERVEADLAGIRTQLNGISAGVNQSIERIGRVETRIGASQAVINQTVTRIGTDTERLRQVQLRLTDAEKILSGARKEP